MREIKFRVWNNADKSMHYPNWEELAIRTTLVEMKLMQYTGRKDRNGVKIYGGDIGKPRSRFSSTLWMVYWDERVCQFRVCAHGDRQFDKTHTVDWIDEVVSNIYENPKLLGKKETI